MAGLIRTAAEVLNRKPGTVLSVKSELPLAPVYTGIVLTRAPHAEILLLNRSGDPLMVKPMTGRDHNEYSEMAVDPDTGRKLAGWGFIRTDDGNYVPANPGDGRLEVLYEGYVAAVCPQP